MAHNIVKHRRGTTAEWQELDSVLIPEAGELVVEECQNGAVKCKIGNGNSKFSELPYVDASTRSYLLKELENLRTSVKNDIETAKEQAHANLQQEASDLEKAFNAADAELRNSLDQLSNDLSDTEQLLCSTIESIETAVNFNYASATEQLSGLTDSIGKLAKADSDMLSRLAKLETKDVTSSVNKKIDELAVAHSGHYATILTELKRLDEAQMHGAAATNETILEYVTRIYAEIADLVDDDITIVRKVYAIDNKVIQRTNAMQKTVDDVKASVDALSALPDMVSGMDQKLSAAVDSLDTLVDGKVSSKLSGWEDSVAYMIDKTISDADEKNASSINALTQRVNTAESTVAASADVVEALEADIELLRYDYDSVKADYAALSAMALPPDGDLEGDEATNPNIKELALLRIGYDGHEYESAAHHVRSIGLKLQQTINSLPNIIPKNTVDGLRYDTDTSLLYLTSGGKDIGTPVEIAGGGGGGGAGGGGHSYRFINNMSSTNLKIAYADSFQLSATFIEKFDGELTGKNGMLNAYYKKQDDTTWTLFKTESVEQNKAFSVEIGNLLELDKTLKVLLTVTCGDSGKRLDLEYTVLPVIAEIKALNFNECLTYLGDIQYDFTCYGEGLLKTVYFEIDNDICDTMDIQASHNITERFTIPLSRYPYGAHVLRVYYKTPEGTTSNILQHVVLYNNEQSPNALKTPLIGAYVNQKINYGEQATITMILDTPGTDVTESVDLHVYSEDPATGVKNTYMTGTRQELADNTYHSWTIDASLDTGTVFIELTCGKTSVLLQTIVSEADTGGYTQGDLTPVTTGLVYAYKASGHSNTELGKEAYEYEFAAPNGIRTKIVAVNEGFNWASNGYLDGTNALTLSGPAKHTIKMPILTTEYTDEAGQTVKLDTAANASVTTNGRTIEFDLNIRNVTDINAHVVECMIPKDKDDQNKVNAGFVITPSIAYLLATDGTNIQYNAAGFVENEDSVATAYIKDNTRLRIAFVIEPFNYANYEVDGKTTACQCVNIYVNGQFAKSLPYTNANFAQSLNIKLPDGYSTASNEEKAQMYDEAYKAANAQRYIRIGSSTCITDLYEVRLYNRCLSDAEVLQNYLTSPINISDRINRLNDNAVLDSAGNVDYYKARNKYACLLVTGKLSPKKDFPGLRGSKKHEAGLILTKPDVEGSFTTEFELMDKASDGYWLCTNNVQGTSSQKFPRKNFKFYLVEAIKDPTTGLVIDDTKYKYALKGNGLSIPESTLCWKSDYMSSDHANTFNANLADVILKSGNADELLESQQNDKRIQNTIYGFRCLLFQRDTETDKIEFVGDGALNNDKSNAASFGLECDDDLPEGSNSTTKQKWEFLNNNSPVALFKTDKLLSKNNGEYLVLGGLESTYPDQGDLEDAKLTPKYDHIQLLYTWVCQRANFLNASTEEVEEPYVYNNIEYTTERAYREAIFKREFSVHFNMKHALTYYLFCEFTALCDNRAKNLFLRCENVHADQIVKTNGEEIDLSTQSLYDDTDIFDASTGEINADVIDWEKSTFSNWIMDLYDLDSCFGVENSGYMQIPYYASWDFKIRPTDEDYKFNGYDSQLWLMFEAALGAEIEAKAQELTNRSATNGALSYDSLYEYHIRNNAKLVCPAVVNADMKYKYQQPWIDGWLNYEQKEEGEFTHTNYKYMQRGSRTEQKDAFIYRRSQMLYSKYCCNKFISNSINFRPGANLQPENTGITLTANQVLYPAIKFGDGNAAVIQRAAKTAQGESVTIRKTTGITVPSDEEQEPVTPQEPSEGNNSTASGATDTIFLLGGTMLTDIGDISKFHPYEVQLQNAIGLKNLKIGSDAVDYENQKLTQLDLTYCKLLEKIDVSGCVKLSTLDLSNNGLIQEVRALNTKLNVILPNGGVVKTLILDEVPTLSILNQTGLETFSCDVSSIKNLRVENTPTTAINALELAHTQLVSLTSLRLSGINNTLDNADWFTGTDGLLSDKAKGKYMDINGTVSGDSSKYPYIQGNVHINSLTGTDYARIKSIYPEITLTFDSITSKVIFKDEDGTVLYAPDDIVITGTDSKTISDPVDDGTISTPIKKSTDQYDYTWAGWTTELGGAPDPNALTIVGDKVLYPAFTATDKIYTVAFVNPTIQSGSKVLHVSYVKFNEQHTYPEYLDVPEKEDVSEDRRWLYHFVDWIPASDLTCYEYDYVYYADFTIDYNRLDDNDGTYDWHTLSYSDISNIAGKDGYKISDDGMVITNVANVNHESYAAIKVPSNITVDANSYPVVSLKGFSGNSVLTVLRLPNTLEALTYEAFEDCINLTDISFSQDAPDNRLAKIEHSVFCNCTKLTNFVIPKSVTSIEGGGFARSGLTKFEVEEGSCFTVSENCLLHDTGNGNIKLVAYIFANKGADKNVTLQENINEIGAYCFRESEIASIDIPESISKIGEYAFYQCKLLTDVTLPDSLSSIGGSCFSTTAISNITLPSTLTSIPMRAFYSTNLQSIKIPALVTSLGRRAFANCTKLRTVTFAERDETNLTIEVEADTFENCLEVGTDDKITFNVPWAEEQEKIEPENWGLKAGTFNIVYNYREEE